MYRQEINTTTPGKKLFIKCHRQGVTNIKELLCISMRKMIVNLIEKGAEARNKQFTEKRLQMVLANVKLRSTWDKRNAIFN